MIVVLIGYIFSRWLIMKLVFINVVMVDMIVIMLMSVNVVVSLFYGVIVMLIVNSSGYVMVVEKNL